MVLISRSPVRDTKFPAQKIDLVAFVCFNMDFTPFSAKIQFFLFIVQSLRHFCMYFITDKDYFAIIIIEVNLDGLYLM